MIEMRATGDHDGGHRTMAGVDSRWC
jgi:hypothetical protein